MSYILLSICCSVSVAALLKYMKRLPIALEQIINANYLAAIILSIVLFRPNLKHIETSLNSPVYISLWILLPSVFIIMALSIRYIGIVKTDIAQRISLVIPILAAYLMFHETVKSLKLIGLLIGFSSIFFTLFKKNQNQKATNHWILPLLVFMGFGTIDILFKEVAADKAVSFTTALFIIFCGAFVIATGITLFYIIFKKTKFNFRNVAWGFLLGILNFGNIFFYLKAHQALADSPSTVFAAMNFGVIALGSFIGVALFKEKLSKMNYFGIFMAVVAVAIITFSQLYEI